MKKLLAAVLALSSAANAATVAAPVNIGVAAAVRGSVKAAAPGAAGRVVETGKPVYAKDRVTTGPEGKLQILLLDQTSFTIGANSEMVLDEFVYDPNTNAGKVSASIAKGAFRFVTGKVARRDPTNMKVDTPVGTIGIRGTIAGGSVDGQEGTFVLLGPGPDNNADEKSGGISVKNEKGSQDVDQDGWGVTVKAGEAPSEPFKLSQSQIDGILGGTGSAPPAGSSGSGDDSASGGDSASSSSGQDTASGKSTAGDAFAAVDAGQSDVSQFASQQFGAPVTAKWADVIAINGGQGTYSGNAPIFSCPGGGACGTTSVGTMDFTMLIDFGAKTLGGGSSSISHTLGGSGTIVSQSYAGLTGDATKILTITGGGEWNVSGVETRIKLLNAGGVTAGQASIDVRWQTSTGQPFYGGTVNGTLQQ